MFPQSITLGSGASFSNVSGQNYPAFEAYLSSNQSVTNNTYVKIQHNTEVFDTNGYYDNSVNYRFTPLVAGKYYVYASVYGFGNTANNLEAARSLIYKNGVAYKGNQFGLILQMVLILEHPYVHAVIDMNGSTDYLEAYGLVETIDNTSPVVLVTFKATSFGAYRIGA
jgi:hypothetical protein